MNFVIEYLNIDLILLLYISMAIWAQGVLSRNLQNISLQFLAWIVHYNMTIFMATPPTTMIISLN